MEENFDRQKRPDHLSIDLVNWIKEYDRKFYNTIGNDENSDNENSDIKLFPLSDSLDARQTFYSKFLPHFNEVISTRSSKKRNKYEDFFTIPSLPQNNGNPRQKFVKIDRLRRMKEKEEKLKKQKIEKKKAEIEKMNAVKNNKNTNEKQYQPKRYLNNLNERKVYKSKK